MAKVLYLRPAEGDVTLANEVSLDEWDCLAGEYEIPGKKCGEILLGENETFWFNCILCHERFLNVAKFCCHVKEVHVIQEADALADPLDEEIPIKVEEKFQTESLYYEMENHDEEVQPDSDVKEAGNFPVAPLLSDLSTKKENSPDPESFEPVESSPTEKTRKRKVCSCDQCGKQYSDKKNLNVHMRVRHTGEKPYQCEECGKFFSYLNNLNAHLIVHAGTRPFKCNICGAGFAHPASLRTHSFLHSGKKPHKCKHCDKAFVSTSSLKVHMGNHASQMPYICNSCGKGFTVKAHYESHMKRENNQRDFRCETCGNAFFNKPTLVRHMACHSNKKKFECDVCQRKFSRQSSLKEHKKLHMATKQHVCDVCKKEFAQIAGLHSHMKQHKKESFVDMD